MSIPEQPQALTLNTQFQLPLPNLLLEQIDWIVFSNNSPYVLEVACGGLLFHVPAWYYYPFPFIDPGSKRRLGTIGTSVTVQPIQQTIPGSSFTAQLFYTVYLNNETPPQTVPSPLGGGPVDLTVASSITNTNSPAGNTEVFLAPQGDSSPGGVVNIKNNGKITLGDNSYAGEIDVFDTTTAEAKILAYILQMFDEAGGQTVNLGSNPAPGATTGVTFSQTSGGPTVALDTANGLTLIVGKMARVAFGGPVSISSGAGGTVITHNLGAIPKCILYMQTGTIASGGTNITVQVDNTTLSATQMTFHANAVISVYWFALA